MIKFLDGDAINAKIIQTIREADDYLLLISPFIKLTDRVKYEISHLVNEKPHVQIEVVFGKNDNDPSKSLRNEDLLFLKTLPNIRISYVKDLHAKIYCSEDRLMLSSMNLHEFSQANNFEAAFVIEGGRFLSGLMNNSSKQAWDDALDFLNKLISRSETVFFKGDIYKSSFLGLVDEKVGEEQEDNSVTFFKSTRNLSNPQPTGYCIRTAKPIPFNLKRPYSEPAFKSWQRFKNEEYKEKYCHYSGEESNGETCFKSPILKKNWRLAKGKFGF